MYRAHIAQEDSPAWRIPYSGAPQQPQPLFLGQLARTGLRSTKALTCNQISQKPLDVIVLDPFREGQQPHKVLSNLLSGGNAVA